jgi:hypothetical protein
MRWSEAGYLSQIVLAHALRQASVSLILDVRQKSEMKAILAATEIEQIHMVLTAVDRNYIAHKMMEAGRYGRASADDLITISPAQIRDYLLEVGIHQFNRGSLSPSKGEGLKFYERGGKWHFSYFERGTETMLSSHESMESAIETRIADVKSELISMIRNENGA